MSNLSVFQFEANQVRVVDVNGEPWFVAKDVCDVLEIKNVSDALSRLREKDRGVVSTDTPSGVQQMNIISEFGLYELVLGSRKQEAKQFKYWICDEVLPSIRKTGSYSIPQVQQPKLSANKQALEISRDVREITDNLLDNPRLAQFLIDHAISDIMPNSNSLSGDRLQGVVEIAEEMGFKVTFNNRSQLGKFVKKICGEQSSQEKRLVNGTMRAVACYPTNSKEVRQAITDFFSR
ncbi:MAG: Bro-N domain-containing protein [Rivularia sp. (in: cyanobacteria)]